MAVKVWKMLNVFWYLRITSYPQYISVYREILSDDNTVLVGFQRE